MDFKVRIAAVDLVHYGKQTGPEGGTSDVANSFSGPWLTRRIRIRSIDWEGRAGNAPSTSTKRGYDSISGIILGRRTKCELTGSFGPSEHAQSSPRVKFALWKDLSYV